MDAGTATPTKIFAGYAGDSRARWQEALALEVTHTRFGLGKITRLDEYLHVEFADGQRRFEIGYLSDPRFFADMALPAHLESDAIDKLRRKLAKSRFTDLKTEYQASDVEGRAAEAQLFSILLKIHASSRLDEESLTWLEAEQQFAPLAHYYERVFDKEAKPADALTAGAYWRKASNHARVLDLTKRTRFQDPADESARLTLRGHAHRDAGALKSAEQCAEKAIKLVETASTRNLLGGIYLDRGDLEGADQHFIAAEDLDSSPEEQDVEIQASFNRAKGAARQKLSAWLQARDAERYAWAQAEGEAA